MKTLIKFVHSLPHKSDFKRILLLDVVFRHEAMQKLPGSSTFIPGISSERHKSQISIFFTFFSENMDDISAARDLAAQATNETLDATLS